MVYLLVLWKTMLDIENTSINLIKFWILYNCYFLKLKIKLFSFCDEQNFTQYKYRLMYFKLKLNLIVDIVLATHTLCGALLFFSFFVKTTIHENMMHGILIDQNC